MRLTLILLLLLLPAHLAAQQELIDKVGTLARDTRVRIYAPRTMGDGTRGFLTTVGQDSLVVIKNNGSRIAVPWSRIRAVDVSTGRSHALGALVGLGLGTVGGAGAGYLLGYGGGTQGENSFYFGMLGAAVGAPLGLVIGAVTGIEQWEPFAEAPRVSLHATEAWGLAVSASVPLR
ncbi:MAG TPA: hypothetical protein VHG28_09420 [Longimicrobiaceae bacterium]|nr:hypothetical protein [Longimicrobiaceae bacterium]